MLTPTCFVILVICPLLLLAADDEGGGIDLEAVLAGMQGKASVTGCDSKRPCSKYAKKTIDVTKSGGYSCSCLAGYIGDKDGFSCYKSCTAAQEKSLECPSVRHACRVNERNEPTCQCGQGYREVTKAEGVDDDGKPIIKKTCAIVDECEECRHNCAANSKCYDLNPSMHGEPYRCECPKDEGLIGNGADSCVSNNKTKKVKREAANEECWKWRIFPDSDDVYKRGGKFGHFKSFKAMPVHYKFDYCSKHQEKSKPCHEFGEKTTDINKHQGYVCRCKQGYSGDGYMCTKNCNDNTADADCEYKLSFSKCGIMKDGKRDCVCLAGTRFDKATKKCMDIDECEECLHDCNTKSRCLNGRIGRSVPFQCICPPHHSGVGNDRCYDWNECDEDFEYDMGWRGCAAFGKTAECLDFDGYHKCNCKPGFRGIAGTGKVPSREATKTASNDTLGCKPSCDLDMTVKHAVATHIVHTAGDKRKGGPWPLGTTAKVVKCAENFLLKDGKATGKCWSANDQTPGKWVDIPECISVCPKYESHIVVKYSHPKRPTGSKMHISCEAGYVLQGPAEGLCNVGKWILANNEAPKCIESCAPPNPKELKVTCNGDAKKVAKCGAECGGVAMEPMPICSLECTNGGVFHSGLPSSLKVESVCLKDVWAFANGTIPRCRPPCPPLSIANAKITYTQRGHKTFHTAGSTAAISCAANFDLDVGKSVADLTTTTSVCNNGKWVHQNGVQPQCKGGFKVRCQKLNIPGTREPFYHRGRCYVAVLHPKGIQHSVAEPRCIDLENGGLAMWIAKDVFDWLSASKVFGKQELVVGVSNFGTGKTVKEQADRYIFTQHSKDCGSPKYKVGLAVNQVMKLVKGKTSTLGETCAFVVGLGGDASGYKTVRPSDKAKGILCQYEAPDKQFKTLKPSSFMQGVTNIDTLWKGSSAKDCETRCRSTPGCNAFAASNLQCMTYIAADNDVGGMFAKKWLKKSAAHLNMQVLKC